MSVFIQHNVSCRSAAQMGVAKNMTAVIAFPIRKRNPADARVLLGPAQVIIFNGVRQERLHDDNIEMNLPMPRKARRSSNLYQATAEELE
jgi:hypothetical protein